MHRIFHNTKFDFIKWWRWAAGLTAAFIAIGLASYAVNPSLNYSIEFTGGTLSQLEFQQPTDAGQLRSTLEQAGINGAEITQYGSPRARTVNSVGVPYCWISAPGATALTVCRS